MPFAMVAVTILLVASAYCAVSFSVQDTERRADNTSRELGLLDSSVDSTRSYIDAELGRIVFDVCTDPALGNLSERGRTIEERMESWIGFQFPLYNAGVTVRMLDHSLVMRNEKMHLGTDILGEDGYVPSYLKVDGTMEAEFENEFGKTVKTMRISTDGSCALPLTLETGSLFENAVTGEGSVISQMMTYQLTSLAQHRVINGYGAFSKYGDRGTASIITENDVRAAYSNSIAALECMYFRDGDGREYFGMTDLARTLAAENGRISVDLNAVYAQALYGKMDDIVGKWFDYFLGNILVDILDSFDDAVRNAWDSLVSFFTGENKFSAEPYIREVIGDMDTRLFTGRSFTFTLGDPDTGDCRDVVVPYPDVDLYGSDIIRNFKNDYRGDTNAIRQWITTVVNSAIVEIANGRGLGTVTLEITDSMTFSEALTQAIVLALRGNMNSFESVTESMMLNNDIPDQFYAAIYDKIYQNRNS